jgi:hypothetical protein
MMDTETREPMPHARLPHMILEDRYTGLLEEVVRAGRRKVHGAVRPSRLQRDLDRVVRGLLEGLIRHALTEEQGAFVEELETLLHRAIVDRVATWDLPA